MELAIILLVIFWVVIPIAAKNSQKKAKAEEERRRAMRQQAPQPQRAQQPVRTTPIAPTVRPTVARSASGEGSASTEGYDGTTFEGELPHDVKPDLATAKSTLTEAKTSITHTVTVSSESGHAHEESSASGIAADCPPEKAPAKQTSAAAPAKAESAFVWDVNAARTGLVMGEILGPCLALRD